MTAKKPPELWLAIDQFGTIHWLRTCTPRAALLEVMGLKKSGGCQSMYVDGPDGKQRHIGYIIRNHWFTLFRCQSLDSVKTGVESDDIREAE